VFLAFTALVIAIKPRCFAVLYDNKEPSRRPLLLTTKNSAASTRLRDFTVAVNYNSSEAFVGVNVDRTVLQFHFRFEGFEILFFE
jgi:hypothetical protein